MRYGCQLCFTAINPPGKKEAAAKCAKCGALYHASCVSEKNGTMGICTGCKSTGSETNFQKWDVRSEAIQVVKRIPISQQVIAPKPRVSKEKSARSVATKPKVPKIAVSRSARVFQMLGLTWFLLIFLSVPVILDVVHAAFEHARSGAILDWDLELDWAVIQPLFLLLAGWTILRKFGWFSRLLFVGFGAALLWWTLGETTQTSLTLSFVIAAVSLSCFWLAFLRWFGFRVIHETIDKTGFRPGKLGLGQALLHVALIVVAGVIATLAMYHATRQGWLSAPERFSEWTLIRGLWYAIGVTVVSSLLFFSILTRVSWPKLLFVLGLVGIVPVLGMDIQRLAAFFPEAVAVEPVVNQETENTTVEVPVPETPIQEWGIPLPESQTTDPEQTREAREDSAVDAVTETVPWITEETNQSPSWFERLRQFNPISYFASESGSESRFRFVRDWLDAIDSEAPLIARLFRTWFSAAIVTFCLVVPLRLIGFVLVKAES